MIPVAAVTASPLIIDTARRWMKIILIIIIALLLVVLAFKIYRAIKRPANAKYIQGGGDVPADFDVTGWTDSVFKAIHGADLTADKDYVFEQFNKLNDNKMIAIYNDWNKRYADFKTAYLFEMGTLTQALKDELPYSMFGGVNNMDLMISNLDRLKLP